ncbi:hypothetical protein [Streptomyces sp. NPDC058674]|uniref:hypothetical protein n=1 Tax=Streptomyces sp. NPDC058674 TaxID=3346592 RepID=UPI003662858E
MCVVALGETAEFGGVAFVLGHPAGEVDELGGGGEQFASGGLGEAAFEPGGDVLGEVADGQVAGVASAEFGCGVAEGFHHVAYGSHLALADADGSGGSGLGPAGDAVHVGQAKCGQRVTAGGEDELPTFHVAPSRVVGTARHPAVREAGR